MDDTFDLSRVTPESHGEVLSINQQVALDLARKLEREASKLVKFTPARMALEGAASRLRDYIAATL